MTDYVPLVASKLFIRNLTTPPLDYDDVTEAELLAKIEAVEVWVKYKYFDGGTIDSDAKVPVGLLVLCNIVSNPQIAKKHYTLASETLGDYSYTIAVSPHSNQAGNISPLSDVITWKEIAKDILEKISTITDDRIVVRKVNE